MPTVEVKEAEKNWLMTLRKDTPDKDRRKESVASVMERIHANYKGE